MHYTNAFALSELALYLGHSFHKLSLLQFRIGTDMKPKRANNIDTQKSLSQTTELILMPLVYEARDAPFLARRMPKMDSNATGPGGETQGTP